MFTLCMRGPVRSYNNPQQVAEDFAKDPPGMPPHLQLTLLNVPPAVDATASLPRPQHVILNHLYCQRNSRSINATARPTLPTLACHICRGRPPPDVGTW